VGRSNRRREARIGQAHSGLEEYLGGWGPVPPGALQRRKELRGLFPTSAVVGTAREESLRRPNGEMLRRILHDEAPQHDNQGAHVLTVGIRRPGAGRAGSELAEGESDESGT
jgi:hypothetical protein